MKGKGKNAEPKKKKEEYYYYYSDEDDYYYEESDNMKKPPSISLNNNNPTLLKLRLKSPRSTETDFQHNDEYKSVSLLRAIFKTPRLVSSYLYRPAYDIYKGYVGMKERGDAMPLDLRTVFLRNIAATEGPRPFQQPVKSQGMPGKDRPVQITDLVVNIGDVMVSEQKIENRPDLVIVMHNPDHPGAKDSIGDLEWNANSENEIERSVALLDGDAMSRYKFFKEKLINAIRSVGLIVAEVLPSDVETKKVAKAKKNKDSELFLWIWAPQQILETRAEAIELQVFAKPGCDLGYFEADKVIDGGNLAGYIAKLRAQKLRSNVQNNLGLGNAAQEAKKKKKDSSFLESETFKFMSIPFTIENRWMLEEFTSGQRILLIQGLIEDDYSDGGAEVRLGQLVRENKLKMVYPLRDDHITQMLTTQWIFNKNPLVFPPIDEIRGYLGEKIAIYFAFLTTYTKLLLIPSLVGIGIFGYGLHRRSQDTLPHAIFGLLLCFWVTIFMELWKQRSNSLAYHWGTEDYHKKEESRTTFVGKKKFGFNVDEGFVALDPDRYLNEGIPERHIPLEPYFSPSVRLFRRLISLIILFISIGVSVLISVYLLRVRLRFAKKYDDPNDPDKIPRWGITIAGILQGIVIVVLEVIHDVIAAKTTEWENHRTQGSHEQSQILKMFTFNVINNYFTLYFTAFVKETALGTKILGEPDRCLNGCINELAYQLSSIMITGQLIGQLFENVIPFLIGTVLSGCKFRARRLNAIEQSDLPESLGTIPEFMELLLQLGYVCIFSMAFPLGAFLALFNNVIELRTDGNKVVNILRRPLYEGASGIGIWVPLTEFIGILALATNVFLIVFTSSQAESVLRVDSLTVNQKWIMAIVIEHGFLLLKFILMMSMPNVTHNVRKNLAIINNSKKVLIRNNNTF